MGTLNPTSVLAVPLLPLSIATITVYVFRRGSARGWGIVLCQTANVGGALASLRSAQSSHNASTVPSCTPASGRITSLVRSRDRRARQHSMRSRARRGTASLPFSWLWPLLLLAPVISLRADLHAGRRGDVGVNVCVDHTSCNGGSVLHFLLLGRSTVVRCRY